VTDHRIGLTLHNLDRMIDGDLGELITALQAAGVAERLKESATQGTTASPAVESLTAARSPRLR
jgi:peptide chain release factor 1